MQTFAEKIKSNGGQLKRRTVDVLQVNLGRYCNLACIHCHVESGPTRKEMMSRENVDAVLRFLARTGIPTLDITGGAPELHPDFAHLVSSARKLGRHVMDRCNLTVIFEPGMEYLPEFLNAMKSSWSVRFLVIPRKTSTSSAAGGPFDASIRALRALERDRLRPAGQRPDC
jgi:radical SAM/Cys-rich protein